MKDIEMIAGTINLVDYEKLTKKDLITLKDYYERQIVIINRTLAKKRIEQ